MKRWLLAAVFTLLPFSALAECRVGGDGHAACGYNCIVDGYGRAVCAGAPDQTCIVDGYGNGACGYNCIVDGYGRSACASAPDQTCIVDGYGNGVCG